MTGAIPIGPIRPDRRDPAEVILLTKWRAAKYCWIGTWGAISRLHAGARATGISHPRDTGTDLVTPGRTS